MDDRKPVFETDEVSASRAREQGLGLGARELAAQRDAGGEEIPEDDTEDVSEDEDETAVDRDTAVLGEDEQLSKSSDA